MANESSPQAPNLDQLAALMATGDHDGVRDLFLRMQQESSQLQQLAETLQQANESLTRENATLAQTSGELEQHVATLKVTVERLDIRVNQLTRILYARRSEKLNLEELGQLAMAFGADPNVPTPVLPQPVGAEERTEEAPPADQPPKNPKKRRPNHHGRRPLADDLERVERIEIVPAEERNCLCCGRAMEVFGYVVHETVEFVPAKLVVEVLKREKLACRTTGCKGDVATAPRAETPSVATRLGASSLAFLVETKCDDGMPLYRIADQFKRLGYDIPVNTLYSAWSYALDLLKPVADTVLSETLGNDVVAVDDTSMPVLNTTKGGTRSKGHLWGFWGSTTKSIAYAFSPTWSAQEVATFFAGIDGFIQVDDYKGYASKLKRGDPNSPVVVDPDRRLGCMMHVRRRFYEALKLHDTRAAKPISLIAEIYKIEAQAKEDGLSAQERQALRSERSLPLLKQFYEWMDLCEPTLTPKSPLAKAIAYAKQQRVFVERCFSDGRFEIDNGEIERRLREPCIGRKNFLHAGSLEAGTRLATAYTLVQTCRSLGVNTRDYLIDIIRKLAGGWPVAKIAALTPARWQSDRVSLRE